MDDSLSEICPKNRGNTQRLGEIKKRNLVEGIIFAVCIDTVIIIIPFVTSLKIALFVIFTLLILIINIVGIRKKSLTETLGRWIKHKLSKKCIRLRHAGDHNENSKFANSSTGEQYRKIKEYFEDSNLNQPGKSITRSIAKKLKWVVVTFRNNLGI